LRRKNQQVSCGLSRVRRSIFREDRTGPHHFGFWHKAEILEASMTRVLLKIGVLVVVLPHYDAR
jgi:hypothetical protein